MRVRASVRVRAREIATVRVRVRVRVWVRVRLPVLAARRFASSSAVWRSMCAGGRLGGAG